MDFCQVCRDFLSISCHLKLDSDTLHVQSLEQLLGKLADLKDALKRKENREIITEETIVQLCSCYNQSLELTKRVANFTASQNVSTLTFVLETATECARCLRNSCAGCSRNQFTVAMQTALFETLHETLETCCRYMSKRTSESFNNKVSVLMRCTVQMLGNLVTGNKEVALFIWKKFSDLFSQLISLEDGLLSSYTCMLVHSCSLTDPDFYLSELVETSGGQLMINAVLQYMSAEGTEWGLYIIEGTLKHPKMLENIWNKIEPRDQNLLLDVMLSQLEESYNTLTNHKPGQLGNGSVAIATEAVHFVLNAFKDRAYTILGLNHGMPIKNEESLLVSKQLSILCTVTALRDNYPDVIQDKDLLKCAINLLHCMKMIGQEGDNVFSPVSKVADLDKTDRTHPVCGLKRDIIRLIANMVYKTKDNQDLVRELGGISLIMDHTNIDGRNPFITQWAVFAIHNLLENNPDNQAVITGMRLEGLSNNIDQLRDFGVEAELDGDRIVIRNVNATQSVSPFSKFYKNER